ncbi:MAG: hypothetical protein K0S19_1836 [Geminicoccaceae bacterium]|nr:hypothetical protein [Geminicoccaceae bacterium]
MAISRRLRRLTELVRYYGLPFACANKELAIYRVTMCPTIVILTIDVNHIKAPFGKALQEVVGWKPTDARALDRVRGGHAAGSLPDRHDLSPPRRAAGPRRARGPGAPGRSRYGRRRPWARPGTAAAMRPMRVARMGGKGMAVVDISRKRTRWRTIALNRCDREPSPCPPTRGSSSIRGCPFAQGGRVLVRFRANGYSLLARRSACRWRACG